MLSLHSRRLEVAGERENGRARGRHARGEGAPAQKAPENRFNSHSVSADISIWSRGSRGKNYPAGRENCQSIVHGQRSEDLALHHWVLKPLNCIQSKFRSRRSLQSGLMGLCGCNLKEKLECSNGIHDGKN